MPPEMRHALVAFPRVASAFTRDSPRNRAARVQVSRTARSCVARGGGGFSVLPCGCATGGGSLARWRRDFRYTGAGFT
jgi:hypothetical protein